MIVLGEDKAEAELYWVDQWDDLNKIWWGEADQSAFCLIVNKHSELQFFNLLITELCHTVFHHDGQESNDDFWAWADQHLPFTPLFRITDRLQSVG